MDFEYGYFEVMPKGIMFMGGGSGGSTNQTQTTTQHSQTTPPDYAVPMAQQGLLRSDALAQMPYLPYPYTKDPLKPGGIKNILTGEVLPGSESQWQSMAGSLPYTSTVAPLNAQQYTSLGNIANYANQPNRVLDTATQQLTDTMGGGYLNPGSNPFLAEYANQALGDVSRNYQNTVVPQLNAGASRAGAFGGSAHTLAGSEAEKNYSDLLSRTATGIYNPAYESERTRQMQAQFFAPTIAQAPITMQQAGLGVGDVYQGQQQQTINDMLAQWGQTQQWPYFTTGQAAQQFPVYGWGSNTNATGTTTASGTSTGSSASRPSSIIGGALSGAGAGSMVMPGWGTAIGGVLGGLAGLFK
jgi:hypothetical protein